MSLYYQHILFKLLKFGIATMNYDIKSFSIVAVTALTSIFTFLESRIIKLK